jgi:hypothetical protein
MSNDTCERPDWVRRAAGLLVAGLICLTCYCVGFDRGAELGAEAVMARRQEAARRFARPFAAPPVPTIDADDRHLAAARAPAAGAAEGATP